ncbi:MAG TPA: VWA domain-containing protein [Candidatus Acidoferrales bacterium]|nr:VWA domain-containing protein [Candidatus Acidoferrales bacterium]
MRVSLILTIFSALSIAAVAQNRPTLVQPPQQQVPAPAQQPTQRPIPSVTRLVVVPVIVKDSQGQLVNGLTRNDFRILEDNVDRPITTFSAEAVPMSAVVVLDNDLSDKEAKQVQNSLETVSAAFGPGDEVALETYDQFPTTVSNFTADNDTLFTQLKRLELGSHSTFVYPDPETAGPINPNPNDPTSAVRVKGPPKYQSASFLDDAVYAAGQMLSDRERQRCAEEAKQAEKLGQVNQNTCRAVRKIIFLVSDGTDARDEKHPYDETLTTLLQHDISVFSISVTRSVPIGKSLLQHGQSQLVNYAANTGGDTFYAAKQKDLDRMYANLTEEARNEYTLTFQPAPKDTAKDFHSIEVRVENHGTNLDILTRDGYYLSSVEANH